MRTVTYITPVNRPMGPKSTKVVEEQRHLHSDADGGVYVVEVEVAVPNVIYGDRFVTRNRYCTTPGPSGGTRLRITSAIHYTKSVWGVVKGAGSHAFPWPSDRLRHIAGFIERNTLSSLEEYFAQLVHFLQRHGQARCDDNMASTSVSDRGAKSDFAVTAMSSPLRQPASRPRLSRTAQLLLVIAVLLIIVNVAFLVRLHRVEDQLHTWKAASSVHVEEFSRCVVARWRPVRQRRRNLMGLVHNSGAPEASAHVRAALQACTRARTQAREEWLGFLQKSEHLLTALRQLIEDAARNATTGPADDQARRP